jgi:nicotinate-nucleotide adenylyltransferase
MTSGSPRSRRIAFFGGSFDPPHLGHIAVAQAAQESLALDRVLLAPVGLQPLKPSGSSASFEDRIAMTRLAIANQPGLEISLLDGPNPNPANPDGVAPNYTHDTLIRLRQSLPENASLFLLLGADSFRTLHQWHRASEIPFLASLIVAARPGEDLTHLAAYLPFGIRLQTLFGQPNQYLLSNSSGDQSQLILLPDLNYDISATQLRNQVHGVAGDEPRLLDPAVLDYIRKRHLYE